MSNSGLDQEASSSAAEDGRGIMAALDNQEKDPPHFEAAPDGGIVAWLVATGAAFVFFCGLGFANSFGIFQQYYMSHQLQGDSEDKVAWIGSLSAFLQFAVGAVAGPLFDRYGAWVVRPSMIIYVFALMMLSLCSKYWQLMLVHGVLIGAIMGVLMFPAIAAVSQYFEKKRAAVLGLAISGSSIGGIVVPIALSKMLNESSLGFGWTVRIIGFVMLPLLAFACITIKPRLPPRTTNFFILGAFKETNFVLLIIAMFFMFVGMFTPLFFMPTYGVYRGMNATLASYLLAILNAASTFGRVIPGVLADKYGPLNILCGAGFANGIVILCMNVVKSNAGLIVYSVVFGFTSGTIISGSAAAFAKIPRDPRDMGTYTGMGMAVGSLAALIGPPINGVLIDKYGGFLQVSIFSGIMCLVGGFVVLVSKVTSTGGIMART
ncbi:major facilitator superfamily domain-containing protein [Thelonectria olida]|uniref:Major facilitator superfamily domain-containing protein n=1 Tax=Thelonectria olida TaxID=1576542 RepID=A0A9P9AN61_9HYPO|nr:major facilitator superfamily domain-containing protein [Thelonectria olida]